MIMTDAQQRNQPRLQMPRCCSCPNLHGGQRVHTLPTHSTLATLRPFFDACDAIWVNYTWGRSSTPAAVRKEVRAHGWGQLSHGGRAFCMLPDWPS